MTDQPQYDPAHLAAAAGQVTPPPVATGPDPAAVNAAAAAGGAVASEVDIEALHKTILAMQARLDAMSAASAADTQAPLVTTAQTLQAQIGEHLTGRTVSAIPSKPAAAVTQLAADAVDAAGAGNTGVVHELADRIARILTGPLNPGPGDHHYWQQALGMTDHLHTAADNAA